MKPIRLEKPIKRGTDEDAIEIKELTLRKPASGELRGIVLSDLLRMEAGSVMTVLPRISQPTLSPHEVAALDPADLMACAAEIAGFLLPSSTMLPDMSASIGQD